MPSYIPFRLPSSVRPTFDPKMMDMPPMTRGVDHGAVSPPARMEIPPMPPQQPPPMRISALEERAALGPAPVPNAPLWRQIAGNYAGRFLGREAGQRIALGGDQYNKIRNYQNRAAYLDDQAKLESERAANEEAALRRTSYSENIASQVEARKRAGLADERDAERQYLADGWRPVEAGIPDMPARPGEQPRFETAQVGGKMRRRETEYGKAAARKEAESVNYREVPSAIAGALGLAPGTKVPPNELDGYVRALEQREQRAADRTQRADLQAERIEATKALRALATSAAGQNGGSFVQMEDADGKPVFYNPNTGETKKPDGLNRGTATNGRATAAQKTFEREANALVEEIDSILAAYEKDKGLKGVGPVAGSRVARMWDEKVHTDKDAVSMRSKVTNVSSIVRHERFGAALTPTENTYAQGFLPETSETADSVVAKLRNLKSFTQRKLNEGKPMEPEAKPSDGGGTVMMHNPKTGRKGLVAAAKVDAAKKAGLVVAE